MLIIISFWICFGIFILINLLNSSFLEDKVRGPLVFFAFLQIMLILGATITGETIFNTHFELVLGYMATAFSLWKSIFAGFKETTKDIYKKLELIEDQTNDIPKLQDDFNDLLQITKINKGKKK